MNTILQRFKGLFTKPCQIDSFMWYCKIFNRTPGWKSATRVPVVPAWSGSRPGPKTEAETANLSPLETLQLFLTEHLVQYVAEQTNLYMVQSQTQEDFQPVTLKEMNKFIGLTLLTGLLLFNLSSCKSLTLKD